MGGSVSAVSNAIAFVGGNLAMLYLEDFSCCVNFNNFMKYCLDLEVFSYLLPCKDQYLKNSLYFYGKWFLNFVLPMFAFWRKYRSVYLYEAPDSGHAFLSYLLPFLNNGGTD